MGEKREEKKEEGRREEEENPGLEHLFCLELLYGTYMYETLVWKVWIFWLGNPPNSLSLSMFGLECDFC